MQSITKINLKNAHIFRKTYIVKDDLHYINEFWGQTLVAIPAPIQAKLEMFDPEGTDSVSIITWSNDYKQANYHCIGRIIVLVGVVELI